MDKPLPPIPKGIRGRTEKGEKSAPEKPVLYWGHRISRRGRTGNPLQEVDDMQEDHGMTRDELEELKAALLEAERLKILEVLRKAESLEEAIKAIEQRVNG